ncbi:MAG: hypothetical protein RB191_15400 [Terriglobia bacterium]|jgi:hypothetical protein|nr:hypothetical protein [Terriglobia bacterium]
MPGPANAPYGGAAQPLVDWLQTVRNIPSRITGFADRALGVAPQPGAIMPGALMPWTQPNGDAEAAQKYMDAAGPKPLVGKQRVRAAVGRKNGY